MSNRSRRRPAGSNRASNPNSNPDSNRGPGRVGVISGTEFGEGPTETVLAQASVLGTWAANQDLQVDQGPWGTVSRVQLDGDPDEPELGERVGLEFDPDLAFGLPQEPRADPLPAGATVDVDESGSVGSMSRGGFTGSSPGGEGVPNPLQARGRAKAFAKLAAAAVMAVSGLLNERLALDEEDETWLADEHDTKAIGDPAGRLVARKMPLPEGTDTTDLADVIEIAIGAGGYLLKNLMARASELRERRRMLREGAAAAYPGS